MSKHYLLPERFRILLTMESDWHVGSGMGRPGNVDHLIARDADGLPFVPAKTLRGIWRDGCERLCRGLDNGEIGEWSMLVDRLFGSQPALGQNDPTGRHGNPTATPLESALQIRSARIPSPLRQQLVAADPRIRQVMTFIKPGVKIDRRSGSAQTDCLRFEELARKGTILEAECQLHVGEAAREVAGALLIASTKLIELLGGKRRRGLGRCRLEILDADLKGAIEWLEQTISAPEWSTVSQTGAVFDDQHVRQQDDPWICLSLCLHLQGPLAVSYRTIGNVVETLDFVPGSYLLPHVTRVLPQLRSGVAAGDVVVLPAYPEIDGERGLPVPMAWFVPKGSKGLVEPEKVVNQLLRTLPDDPQHKQMREGYVSTQSKRWYKTPITVQTHNTVEDQLQRPTSDVGGVYTYEAIAPVDNKKPVVLRSELRIRKSLADQLGRDWWKTLCGEVTLGRSKKDDYGSVTLEVVPSERKENHEAVGSELFVWLVSDTLIRNRRLRPEPTAECLGEELSRVLGVRLKLLQSADGRLDELVRIRRLDTWHVGWGLPRPSLVTLQAGSCMVFTVEGQLDLAKLAQLEAGGIGERIAEGYGQVRFNHPLITKPLTISNNRVATTSDTPGGRIIAAEDPANRFARLLERECWKQEIRWVCLTFANSPQNRRTELGWVVKGDQGQPPMSQLGGLRGQLAMLRTVADRKQVIDWLDHLAENNRRRDKWPSITKVKNFIESDTRIWEIIKPDGWPTLTVNAQGDLRQELWPLAVRTFFDACIRAHKREVERGQQREEATCGA